MKDLTQVCICPEQTLRDAMMCINQNAKGIALVVYDDGRLYCTITDGDLRRALLSGLSLDMRIEDWARQYTKIGQGRPVTVPQGTSHQELLHLMQAGSLRHIPLLDDFGRVTDLALLSELITDRELPLSAIVMAGGNGLRLRPLTEDLPKPMLPVGDRPIIEHIIDQLRRTGICEVRISTHYKSETIVRHLGDGQKFGMKINYIIEDSPLGTAGALGLMSVPKSTVLAVNGDILTQLNYRSMLAFHQDNKAVMTVAVRQYVFQVPYGVVEMEGIEIQRLIEKPPLQYFVNAGIYLLEPEVFRFLVPSQKFDMTDLIACLLTEKKRVVSFPISEYWLDIGRRADYEKAQIDFAKESN